MRFLSVVATQAPAPTDCLIPSARARKKAAKDKIPEAVVSGNQNAEPSWPLDEACENCSTEEALRESRQELRRLSAQLLTIQEAERQRIAADLHDGIGQSLGMIKLSMELVAQSIQSGRHQEAVESIQQLVLRVKDAIAELRRTTSDLRPSCLDDLGILPTMTWFFREFEQVCRDKHVERTIDVEERDVPVPLKPTIFRILQESMNNIVKHADADRIRVGLIRNGNVLQFSIEDNGRGFDLAGIAMRKGSSTGFGLLTMKERAVSSNGYFEIRSSPGQGTTIRISWRIAGQTARQSEAATSRVRER